MPKFMPSPAIASAPAARIAPDAEKNQRDLPMKSKREKSTRSGPAPSEDGRRAEHGGEQRDDRADPEREREALHPGRGQREQDERHADRHNVGVDDRPERLRVSGGDGGRD